VADDAHVREIGRVEDDRGHVIIVGVDHDTVTLEFPRADTSDVALSSYRAEEFAQLLVSACWQAGWHQGWASRMRDEP